jgi:hypothetical protein
LDWLDKLDFELVEKELDFELVVFVQEVIVLVE